MVCRVLRTLFISSFLWVNDSYANLEIKEQFIKPNDFKEINQPYFKKPLKPQKNIESNPDYPEPPKADSSYHVVKNSDGSKIKIRQHSHDPFMNQVSYQSRDILSESLK